MKTLVSAHNCIFGPRHLGIYGSTLRHWTEYQNKYNCFFVIDDLIGHFTHPIDHITYTQKAHIVGYQFLQSGINPSKANIVLISQIPEIYELSFLIATFSEHALLEKNFNESLWSKLNLNQRSQLGLPDRPSFSEVFYPNIIISAYILGLKADIWQGGLEITANHSNTERLLRSFENHKGRSKLKLPSLLYGEPRSVLGCDSNHMTYLNRLELQAEPDEIRSQISSIENFQVINSWFYALGIQKTPLLSDDEITDSVRDELLECTVVTLSRYRNSSITNEDVISAMRSGTEKARTRICETLNHVQSKIGIGSYL